NIEVARDQGALGNDPDRVAKLGQHFQAAARELKLALGRLIAIGDAADAQGLWLPLGRSEFLAEQLRGVFLDEDLRLEIEARGKAEVFVRGPGVTVDTAVLAAAIRIDARGEADIRGVVIGDETA